MTKKEKERFELLKKAWEIHIDWKFGSPQKVLASFVKIYNLTITNKILWALYIEFVENNKNKYKAWIKKNNIKAVDKLTKYINEDTTIYGNKIKTKLI